MRNVLGLLFLGAGVGVAAYALAPADKASFAVFDATTDGARSRVGALSPDQSLFVSATRPTQPNRTVQRNAADPRIKVASLTEETRTPGYRTDQAELARWAESTKPATASERFTLARDLQRELKRVGCYHADVDGSWGGGSRRALSEFMDRVNASLPGDEPDYIMLALVRNQATPVCGSGCPRGQDMAGDGRCVPSAVLAQRARKAPNGQPADGTAPKLVQGPQLAERRVPDAAASAKTVSNWSATVQQADERSAAVASGAVSPPLPGRMAIGAPTAPAQALELTSRDGSAVKARDQDNPGGPPVVAYRAPVETPVVRPAPPRSSYGQSQSSSWKKTVFSNIARSTP